MRKVVLLVLLAIPGVAFGRSSVRASFGHRGAHGGGRRGGVSFSYHHRTPYSSFSLRFGGGSWHYGYSGGYYYSGGGSGCYYPGYGSAGVCIYRGWVPQSPYLYRSYPGVYWGGGGPLAYTDAVIFSSSPAGAVFGHGQRTADAAAPAVDAVRLPAATLIDRGDERFRRGDFQGAVELYRAAATKKPNDPMAALALGHGLFAAGTYGESATELRRAVRLYPAIVQVRMNRRDFYGRPATFDAQLVALERHVEAAPADAAARFLLGYNYFFTQQYARAKVHFAALGGGDAEAQLFLREIRRLESEG